MMRRVFSLVRRLQATAASPWPFAIMEMIRLGAIVADAWDLSLSRDPWCAIQPT